LNTDTLDENLFLEKLPFWGNYIIHKDSNEVIEFEPTIKLKEILEYFEVKNSKRPALQMKTTDLLKSIIDILWASS